MKMKRAKGSMVFMTGASIAAICGAIVLTVPRGVLAEAGADRQIPETLAINLQKQCPDIKGLPADKKSVKAFTHAKHAAEYLKGKEKFSKVPYTDGFTCAACHAGARTPDEITPETVCDAMSAELEKTGGARKMANHFHNTCKACHSAMKKAGEKTGPVSCKGCHGR